MKLTGQSTADPFSRRRALSALMIFTFPSPSKSGCMDHLQVLIILTHCSHQHPPLDPRCDDPHHPPGDEQGPRAGTVACTLLKDIGNATNQPYLQAIASVSLLIMETVQRVESNKDDAFCQDDGAQLAPAMVRSIDQFSETLEKILTFVRSQIKGGFWRRMLRSMEDADLITECNAGLKHALDVLGVQSDATKRHEELIAILKEKRSRPKRSSSSSSDGASSSGRKKRSSAKPDLTRSVSMLPASPKIFYGREEVKHLVNTIMRTAPTTGAARIAICSAEGVGKTALALAAAHSPEVSQLFGPQRYFIECEGATDAKQLVGAIALALGLESTGRKPVVRQLTALGGGEETKTSEGETAKEGEEEKEKEKEKKPVLLVLDALDRAWKPHENRSAVEDFLSLLADLQHVTLIVSLPFLSFYSHRPRWRAPAPSAVDAPLPPDARPAPRARRPPRPPTSPPPTPPSTPSSPSPRATPQPSPHGGPRLLRGLRLPHRALGSRGPALLQDKAEHTAPARPIILDGVLTEEPDEMRPEERERVPGAVREKDLMALLESCVAPTQRPMPSIDSLFSDLGLAR
ncbi:hypothetical protein C8R44DRAFT_869265 [Mycena epipterygia]|nr:hypothetical protein C8R44DRAFT_869265 [Mycena epipterygia]